MHVWEKLTTIYKDIIEQVVKVEKVLGSKTGEQKKEVVVDYIAGLYNVPFIPDFIETPLKRKAVGYLIDKVVDKLNIITDFAGFGDVPLTKANVDTLVQVVDKPNAAILDAVNPVSAASIDDKFAAMTAKFNTSTPAVVKDEVVPDAFDKCISFSLKWEGGKNYEGEAEGIYTMLNKADKGGPTNMGVTLPTLIHARIQGIISSMTRLDDISIERVKAIYKANYWTANGFEKVEMPVALCCLDCSINHGGFAWILQRALNDVNADKVKVDGKYGNETKQALITTAGSIPFNLAKAIVDERKAYYDAIIEKDASQVANQKGWYNRVRALAEEIGVASPC